jgi:hypothetical protein
MVINNLHFDSFWFIDNNETIIIYSRHLLTIFCEQFDIFEYLFKLSYFKVAKYHFSFMSLSIF